MKKRILAVLLATIMVISLIPTMVFAEAESVAEITHSGVTTQFYTIETAITAAVEGDEIILKADLNNLNTVCLPAGVTLNGDGHKITGESGIYINTNGSTVKNIVFENIHNTVKVDAEDCKYYSWPDDQIGTQSAIYAENLVGTATITGCSFDNIDWDAIQISGNVSDNAKVVITDNVFMHTNESSTQIRYIHVQPAGIYGSYVDVTVTGNRFYKSKNTGANPITTIGLWKVYDDQLHLTGNYYEYSEDVVHTDATVSYGLYSNNCEGLFPAIGNDGQPLYYVALAGNVAYLKAETTPAMMGGYRGYPDWNYTLEYTSLAEAIEGEDDDVCLLRDVYENVTIPEDYEIEIDLDEYAFNGTITNNGSLQLSYGGGDCNLNIINNGTITLDCDAAEGISVVGGTVEIEDGGVYDLSKFTNVQFNITGGDFKTKPSDDIMNDFYIAVQEDGVYTVRKMTDNEAKEYAVAKQGSYISSTTFMRTLDNITDTNAWLLKDVENGHAEYGAGSNYGGLYTNGYSFTGSVDMGSRNYIILYGDNFVLTDVIGKELDVGTYSKAAKVTIQNALLPKLSVQSLSECTIEGGKFDEIILYTRYANKSETEPQQVGKLIITGGLFKSNDITHTIQNHDPGSEIKHLTDFVPVGYKVIDIKDGEDGYSDGYRYKVVSNVAKIGTTEYATLAEAVEAVPDGVETTITMIANETLNEDLLINKNIILDLNGKTVECGDYFFNVAGTVVITGDGTVNKEGISNTTELKYPSVTGEGKMATFFGSIYVAPEAILTIENGTFTTKSKSLIVCNNGILTMKDGLFKCTSEDTYDTKGLVDVRGENGVLNLLGGSVECYENSGYYYGMYGVTPWDNATLNLGAIGTDGPTVHSYYAAICTNGVTAPAIINVYSGTYISDCDVTDEDAECDMNVVQISANEKAGTEVNIYGGTFTQTAKNATNSHVIEVRWKAEKAIHIYGGDFKSAGSVLNMNTELDESNTALSITGGYYTADVSDYVADGYKCVPTPNTDPKHNNYSYMIGKIEVEVAEVTEADKTKIAEKAANEVQGATVDQKDYAQEAATDAVEALTENTEVIKVKTNVAEAVETKVSDIIARAAEQAVGNHKVDSAEKFTGGTNVKTDTKIEVKLETVKVDAQTVATAASAENIKVNTAVYDVKPIANVTTTYTDGEGEKVTVTETVVLTNEDLNGKPVTVRLAVAPTTATLAKVTHRSEEEKYDDEVFYAPILGTAPNQYVEIQMTHFSEVEVETLTSTINHKMGHQDKVNATGVGRAIIPLTEKELADIGDKLVVVYSDGASTVQFEIDCAYTYFYDAEKGQITAEQAGFAAFVIIENHGNNDPISGYGHYILYSKTGNSEKVFLFDANFTKPNN